MRTVFIGTGAFVARIEGESRCAFWPRHPDDVGFDPSGLIRVDLAMNTQAARDGKVPWSRVLVDEHVDYDGGGATTIGPLWPDAAYVGAAYLSAEFLAGLPPEYRPPVVPVGFESQARPYEFTSAVYWGEGGLLRRYYGFHARILDATTGGTRVALYHAGQSRIAVQPACEVTIDLGARAQCDAHVGDGGLTEIGGGDGAAREGALYVDWRLAAEFGLRFPKLPPGLQEGVSLRRRDLATPPPGMTSARSAAPASGGLLTRPLRRPRP